MSALLWLTFLLTFVSSKDIRQELKAHPNWKLLDRGDDCGRSSSDRIIGGSKAKLGQYPWIARIGYSFFDLDNITAQFYGCGGSIISENYILTAAHCNKNNVYIVSVRLGEHDVVTDPDCVDDVCAPPVQDIIVDEVRCHDSYVDNDKSHDICLIRLVNPIRFDNRFVNAICLPVYEYFQSNSFDGLKMDVAGWGITDTVTRKTSDVLLKLKVPIVSHFRCRLAFKNRAVIDNNSQLCAGGVIGEDSCGGDSGGPLMYPFSMNAPPRVFQVGIVSFGEVSCGTTRTPGVYTRVSSYILWILDNIR